jgi:DNA repair exonuclease SbcCD ATPase subunit
MLLNVAKHAWRDEDNKSIHYIMNDAERVFLNVEEDFLYSDLDVFLSDSTKQNQDIEAIKTLLQPAMQNGATLLEAAEILSSENLSQIKAKLSEIEDRRQQLMAQSQEAEIAQRQFENQIKQDANRIDEEDSIRKAETAINVEIIKAGAAKASMGTETQGVVDPVKLMEFQADLEKQKAEIRIKDEQNRETARKNKKAEDQKQQEIEIKRKQANRPVATKTK